MQNVTRKMVITWAVAFVGILLFGFGTPALVLHLIKDNHNPPIISANNILRIEYSNPHILNDKEELFNGSGERYASQRASINNIANLLASGGTTTRLNNFFSGRSRDFSIEESNLFSSTFESTYAGGFIIIWFRVPQHSITGTTSFTLTSASTNPNSRDNVLALYIPLNRANDRFQEQTWYIARENPQGNPPQNTTYRLNRKISLHGNYSELWDYVYRLPII